MRHSLWKITLLALGALLLLGGGYKIMELRSVAARLSGEALSVRLRAGSADTLIPMDQVAPLHLRAGSADKLRRIGDPQTLARWSEYLLLTEEDIYTFYQGPRAWYSGIPWGGEWCEYYVSGQSFGGFGCGLVCMANIYSTLTPYECSPLDMYRFATANTWYHPTPESGAIDWGYMKQCLKLLGFSCDMYYKPETYEEFQRHISEVDTAIVLVDSANSDEFWKDIPGHYVTIWLYDEKTDKVFLADSGTISNNRSWIPLRYVYDALKTSSKYQYLTVWDYQEEGNSWKWDGISDNWNGPGT